VAFITKLWTELRLGLAYGIPWALILILLMSWAQGNLAPLLNLQTYAFFLATTVSTAACMTQLCRGWLTKISSWMILPCGLMLLSAAIAIWALAAVICMSGFEGVNAKSYLGTISMMIAFSLNRYAYVLFMLLAVLNCWDLRRRMIQAAAQG
jgi:hypothetical protein